MSELPPLLYSYRRCPYAMRARMALLWGNHRVRLFDVKLSDKPDHLLRCSPKGTVPVLVLPDGQVIDESWDIMRWALSGSDPDGLWRRAQVPEAVELLERNDREFKFHLDRYKYPERHDGNAALHQGQAVAQVLEPLERRLQHGGQLLGEPSAIDLALLPFVRQFAAVDPLAWDGLPLPSLKRWLQAWLVHPVFVQCMQKVPSAQEVLWPAPGPHGDGVHSNETRP